MSTDFISLNKFVRADTRVDASVYVSAESQHKEFNYSDGESTENKLRTILTSAQDLSSYSSELQAQIIDWPTEYHLSSVRANLLRGFDLTGVNRVLELGCGCGSITRYLGEQGLQVDSVEGSPIRAELAALRCRDLPNVSISTANFNDIQLPQGYYDLVLFVGVTEYAGRFSDKPSDEEALQDLLQNAKAALKTEGTIFVAIENRTGLKYILGSNEDHYALPYVGINGYPDSTGIRTYTKQEWQQQIKQAGFNYSEFIYPFPDYKIPSLLLHENYVDNNKTAYIHLETIRSRDYTSAFSQGCNEAVQWQAASEANVLGELANSFVILMSNQLEPIQTLAKFDVVELPDFSEMIEYCTGIYKTRGQKDYSIKAVDSTFDSKLKQTVKVINHTSLSSDWYRSVTNNHNDDTFKLHLKDYFEFISKQNKLSTALLPSNLIQQGSELVMQLNKTDSLTLNSLFFRACSHFFQSYREVITLRLANQHQWKTVSDFVVYAFSTIGITVKRAELDELLKTDQQLDAQILRKPSMFNLDEQFFEAAHIESIFIEKRDDGEKQVLLLKKQIKHLEQTVAVMENTKGWKVLSKLRGIIHSLSAK